MTTAAYRKVSVGRCFGMTGMPVLCGERHIDVVTDELYSDSQGLHREMWARRRDSEIVALRTGT